MSEQGYISISRRAFQHFLWKEPREKSRWEAWVDLIQTAAYAPHSVLVEGRCLNLARGELVASVRFLGTRWGWDKNRVSRFMGMLKSESMIRTRTDTGISVVSLCKYDLYNPMKDTNGTATHTNSGQKRDSDGTKIIRERKEKEGKEDISSEASSEQVVMKFPVVGGSLEWSLTESKFNEYEETFPDMNVRQVILNALQWVRDNQARRKTPQGMPRFLSGWLSKAQNSGRHVKESNASTPRPVAAYDADPNLL